MSAAEALRAARSAGVHVEIDGGDLSLSAPAAPPAAVLDLLARHKAGVIALLRSGDDGWSGEDWRAFFDERAGIAEFDGGLPRAEAEGGQGGLGPPALPRRADRLPGRCDRRRDRARARTPGRRRGPWAAGLPDER